MLIDPNNRFVCGTSNSRFMTSLTTGEKDVLVPGEYKFIIDPVWNETTDNDEDYNSLQIDIFTTEQVDIQPYDDFSVLVEAFKNYALETTPEEKKKFHVQNDEAYKD